MEGEIVKHELGLVHVKTGDGPGKTTSSFGLALRAAGRGFKVLIVQFMKKGDYGEVAAIRYVPNMEILQFSRDGGVENIGRALKIVEEAVKSGRYDMVILDEINVALSRGLVKLNEVLRIVKEKLKNVELVLTGRDAPRQLYEVADYVTEFKEVKHPYSRGIAGRKGVEY